MTVFPTKTVCTIYANINAVKLTQKQIASTTVVTLSGNVIGIPITEVMVSIALISILFTADIYTILSTYEHGRVSDTIRTF